jgi:hypothetical protein
VQGSNELQTMQRRVTTMNYLNHGLSGNVVRPNFKNWVGLF